MILQPTTVELTKIHFYNDYNNREISTISREIPTTVVIKKNLFRNRWVLKINEIGTNRKTIHWHFIIILVSCIIVAVTFGLYFGGITPKLKLTKTHYNIITPTPSVFNKTHENVQIKIQICENCDQICLKRYETDIPQCLQPIDKKDPTGCGGFCSINTQYCRLLDHKHRIYQCSNLKNILKCPNNTFNCGNMCINLNKRCDGIIHCSNKIDEINCDCNLKTHFHCGNMTSCLEKSKQCDGFVDCWDKSDEFNCKKSCKNGTIPCLNGNCILKEHFCDGKYQCDDLSDEPQGC